LVSDDAVSVVMEDADIGAYLFLNFLHIIHIYIQRQQYTLIGYTLIGIQVA